jgi:phage pi2 protein 07
MIKFKLIGVNYLHSHPHLEKTLNVPDDHIIVDKKEWETVIEYLQSNMEFTSWINKNKK